MRTPHAVGLALWAVLLGLCTTGRADQEPLPLPGPAPQRLRQPAAALNRECVGCHLEIAKEWRASYHRLANRDPDFQRALAREPVPFCRRCHAPEADPSRTATGWPAENGVACVTCHVLGDEIVSGPGQRDRLVDSAPHPVRRDPRLSSEGACLRCHEFQFPDGRLRRRAELMQRTVSEHHASAEGNRSCIDCHMPRLRGPSGGLHRSHSFLSGHDAPTLRAALRVEATRSRDSVTLLLTPQQVGHAFPTGDLFRRLVLTVAPEGAPRLPVQHRELQRHFINEKQLPGHPVRVTARDDRLTGPTAISFPLPALAEGRSVHYRIVYQRVAFPTDSGKGRAAVDGEVLLGSGTLPPEPR